MQSVEISGIDQLLESWDRLIQDYPAMKGDLLESLGEKLLAAIREQIGGGGQVQKWQTYYVGSGLGYSAARAKAETYKVTKGGKRYAVGYVTNAIENGHKVRRPSPVKRDGYIYRPRITEPAVAGRYIYDQTRARMGHMGQEELERLAQELVQRLEGNS